ncbi:hypothetical protein RRG08_041856 [Elysia crispata]|uniref:Uncharacterized protein n=1 Tax=Elysia crispata TaxID=231223 RepID=A0AAE1CQE5_9GAST|nr:hypothetical protein RRG08_041856 [Elysia crispata]
MKCAAVLIVLLYAACVSAQTGHQQGPPMNFMSMLAMKNMFDNFLPMMYFMNPQMMSSMGMAGGSMAPFFFLNALS